MFESVTGTAASQAEQMGIDLPIPVQFWHYLLNVLQGDFGNSIITSHPVLEDVLHFFPATFELATVATVIGVLLGIPMGVLGATKQGRWPDQVVRVVGLVGYSAPIFWLGLIGLLVFYSKLGWVAGPGRLDVAYDDLVIVAYVRQTLAAGERVFRCGGKL